MSSSALRPGSTRGALGPDGADHRRARLPRLTLEAPPVGARRRGPRRLARDHAGTRRGRDPLVARGLRRPRRCSPRGQCRRARRDLSPLRPGNGTHGPRAGRPDNGEPPGQHGERAGGGERAVVPAGGRPGSMDEPDAAGIEDPVPASPYATAKWAGVAYGQMFHRVYGTPVVIARTFRTYGPGQHATKLVPHVILGLSSRPATRARAWRDSIADWVYIDDVIDGFLAVALNPGRRGPAYSSSGPGTPRSNREVVEEIVALIGSEVEPSYGAIPARSVRAGARGDSQRQQGGPRLGGEYHPPGGARAHRQVVRASDPLHRADPPGGAVRLRLINAGEA